MATKIFISQPMNGRSDKDILEERESIIRKASDEFGAVEMIDSYFENAPHEARPLWFLGKSLELLSTADVAYFAPGWDKARGCIIEHSACIAYGIDIVEIPFSE